MKLVKKDGTLISPPPPKQRPTLVGGPIKSFPPIENSWRQPCAAWSTAACKAISQ